MGTDSTESLDDFDPEFVESVVVHMNQDHADAVRLYAHGFAGYQGEEEVKMTGICSQWLILTIGESEIRIRFDPALSGPEEVRSRLVSMAAEARKRSGE